MLLFFGILLIVVGITGLTAYSIKLAFAILDNDEEGEENEL